MEVDGWLARAAAARPQSTAIETPQGSWSYERLALAARAKTAASREPAKAPKRAPARRAKPASRARRMR